MGLRERVVEWLGAVPAAQLEDARNRAYEAGFYDGNDDPASGDIAKGGFGYKRISDNYLREGKIDYTRALETAWALWQKSPIAKRVLVMKRDHIIGHNARPSVEDVDLAELLQAFWEGNKLEHRASEFTMQLFGMGEQCYPAFVRESDGRVRLGYIDPGNIHQVVKHPNNTLEDWAVVVKKPGAGMEYLVYRIIREDEDVVTEDDAQPSQYEGMLTTWEQSTLEDWEVELWDQFDRPEYDGSCFYAKVNAVSNQSRGMSDLLQIGDWLDQADEVLFALADREQFAGYFAFDVTLASSDDAVVRKRAREIRSNPPKKGSVNVHNDSEAWNQWAPNLGQTGTIETFRAILGLILGGMGFPVHWYGFGDDANRATAAVQAEPTTKSLEHDQAIVKSLFLTMCRFAIDQASIAGVLGDYDDEAEVMLDLPEVSTKDTSRITASLSALAQALIAAQQARWISEETAARTWAKVLGELDIQVDPAAELEAIAAEDRQRALDEEQARNDGLQQAMNGNEPEPDEEMIAANGNA